MDGVKYVQKDGQRYTVEVERGTGEEITEKRAMTDQEDLEFTEALESIMKGGVLDQGEFFNKALDGDGNQEILLQTGDTNYINKNGTFTVNEKGVARPMTRLEKAGFLGRTREMSGGEWSH